MRIDNLILSNFRNFGEPRLFEFPRQFTVVIGDNGQGKSTILQGLRLAAATFLLGIDEAERHHIDKEDVRRIDIGKRFVPQKNCSFEALWVSGGIEIRWKRTRSTAGEQRTTTKEAKQIIEYATELNHRVNDLHEENVDLPVLCFFSTARLWSESKHTFKLKKKGSILKDGYARCLTFKPDKITPWEWIKSYYIKQLKEQIKGKSENGLWDAVLEAIAECVPNWKPVEWDEDSDDLTGIYTYEDGSTAYIPLFYLSDGLRTMATMAASIAYRCAVLNSHRGKDAIKESRGIVLIDELDMHIHPKWQKHVVGDLKKAFPHIQFIATTHSEYIVQSLENDELINLDKLSDVSPNELRIDQVATEIMGVESAYSLDNQEKYVQAKTFLENLNGNHIANGELEKQLDAISDPGLRAFLELNKMAQGK
ncbi:MAG: AAA family ATPase [Saprospiraceae bacterium]|nr:AAA family ATPase [Saprospiraceae bacterium]